MSKRFEKMINDLAIKAAEKQNEMIEEEKEICLCEGMSTIFEEVDEESYMKILDKDLFEALDEKFGL